MDNETRAARRAALKEKDLVALAAEAPKVEETPKVAKKVTSKKKTTVKRKVTANAKGDE